MARLRGELLRACYDLGVGGSRQWRSVSPRTVVAERTQELNGTDAITVQAKIARRPLELAKLG